MSGVFAFTIRCATQSAGDEAFGICSQFLTFKIVHAPLDGPETTCTPSVLGSEFPAPEIRPASPRDFAEPTGLIAEDLITPFGDIEAAPCDDHWSAPSNDLMVAAVDSKTISYSAVHLAKLPPPGALEGADPGPGSDSTSTCAIGLFCSRIPVGFS
jgi:hypothetical protein